MYYNTKSIVIMQEVGSYICGANIYGNLTKHKPQRINQLTIKGY